VTRYRLPDVLGGGELDRWHTVEAPVGTIAFIVNGHLVCVAVKLLTEVEPPLPPEPPVGSVVLDRKGHAWQAVGPEFDDIPAAWYCTHDTMDQTWAELNAEHGPLTLLVPEVQP
jgi:hypothetical protein